jgi:hypothetical protein
MRGMRAPLLLCSVLALVSMPAAAQLIELRTVPVASGDQFLIFPSEHLGMGGVHIALADTWLDPFVNPARGASAGPSQVFALPTFYSVGQRAGSAATLSAGGFASAQRVFGGGLVALQQIKSGQNFFFGGPLPVDDFAVLPPDALSQRSATNKYAALYLGTRLPAEVAIGAGVTLADLGAIDGVEHLYALATNITQFGHLADVRFGIAKGLTNGGSLEGSVLYDHVGMTHDVTYLDWTLVDSTTGIWQQTERREINLDRTSTWGVHLAFRRPVGTSGWRLGGILTGNYKSHPKIPNYEIVNIPRDPGHSTALDIGIGMAKQANALTVGMDLVYEPGWSSTWALAGTPQITANGDTIPAGGRTVENEFRFSNARIAVGAGYAVGVATLQFGLQVRANDYHLDQWDNVASETRRQDEQWMEWVPSWGVRLRLKGLDLQYAGRVTTGTGRPGVAWTGSAEARAFGAGLANDIVVPPGGPLTLQEAAVWTHQFSVTVPIR